MQTTRQNQKGFSLVELMAILVILAVSTSLALPSFKNSTQKSNFKKDTHELMAHLRGFKLKAISTGVPLTISYENQQFIDISREEHTFKELSLHADTTVEIEPEILYFSPQGWARPAIITLTQNNRSQTIKIDPLTARPYKLQTRPRR